MKKDNRAGIPLEEAFAEAEKDPSWKVGYARAEIGSPSSRASKAPTKI
jgi:hypothetical protein